MKEYMIEQRKYFWQDDYWRKVIVPLFKLKSDSVILDVGCAHGFIGQNLVEFVPDGRIVGVDLNEKLIEEAKRMTENDRYGNVFDFRVGDACKLPLDNEYADLSICQTLLIHLAEPTQAIMEMRRVTKKGGRMVVMEPAHLGVSLFNTAEEVMGYSFEQRLEHWQWQRMILRGRKKRGKGEYEIGAKVPYLFLKCGLRVVDVRAFNYIFWLIPPYERPGDEVRLKHVMEPPEHTIKRFEMREDFLAGGGTEKEWSEYLRLQKEEYEISKRQVKEKSFVIASLTAVTITIGEKS